MAHLTLRWTVTLGPRPLRGEHSQTQVGCCTPGFAPVDLFQPQATKSFVPEFFGFDSVEIFDEFESPLDVATGRLDLADLGIDPRSEARDRCLRRYQRTSGGSRVGGTPEELAAQAVAIGTPASWSITIRSPV